MGCTKVRHGFCASCVEKVGADPAGHDMPQRYNPEHPMLEHGPVDRDFLHSFHMCECGVCAFCGNESDDDCCGDHESQLCSCFPEVP